MKNDLDRIMEERKLDAIVIDGFSGYDPNIFYFLQVPHLGGLVIKKRAGPPVLIHGLMEREEAKKTGLDLVEITKYEYHKIVARQKDTIKAWAELVANVFTDLGVRGRICYYGLRSTGAGYYYLKALLRQARDVQVVREPAKTALQEARETKSSEEVARVRSCAERTEDAVGELVNYIKKQKVSSNRLVKEDGTPLTVGDAKSFLSRALLERGLIEISGTILSTGHDAGVPHSTGNDRDVFEIGKVFILDVFPRELAGGYYYDFTRTFVLGQASAEIAGAYQLVAEAHAMLLKSFKPGVRTRACETKLCKLFEKHGHPTPLSTPGTKNGYIHSLGHGVGLEVHEKPAFGLAKTNKDFIKPGALFTVEPGLYYPDKDFGVRIEDVVYVNEAGVTENLSKYPKDLLLKI